MSPYLQNPLIDWRMDDEGNVNPYIPNPYGGRASMVQGQAPAPKFKPQPNAMGQLPMPTSGGLLDDTPTQPQAPQGQGFGDFLKSADGLSGIGAMMLSMSNNDRAQALGMKALDQIGKQRKSTALSNKTVEALRNMDREDLATAVESGMLSATEAYKEAIKKKDPVKGVEFQGNLVNPYTGEVISEGKGSGYLDPKEQLSALNVLRDDLRNDLGEFNATQSAWNKISYLYENQSGTADYALTVAFANILDPGSVVRGEEQEAIARSGALSEAMKEQLANVLTGGGTLPPKVRDDILNIAKNQYSNKLKDARGTYDHYTKLASNYGLDPSYLYSGSMEDPQVSTLELTPKLVSSIKAQDPEATDAEIAEWWNSLTTEQKKEQLKGGK